MFDSSWKRFTSRIRLTAANPKPAVTSSPSDHSVVFPPCQRACPQTSKLTHPHSQHQSIKWQSTQVVATAAQSATNSRSPPPTTPAPRSATVPTARNSPAAKMASPPKSPGNPSNSSKEKQKNIEVITGVEHC